MHEYLLAVTTRIPLRTAADESPAISVYFISKSVPACRSGLPCIGWADPGAVTGVVAGCEIFGTDVACVPSTVPSPTEIGNKAEKS